MISSSDGGQTFTPWHVVDDRQTFAKNASPQLIISQGSCDRRRLPRPGDDRLGRLRHRRRRDAPPRPISSAPTASPTAAPARSSSRPVHADQRRAPTPAAACRTSPASPTCRSTSISPTRRSRPSRPSRLAQHHRTRASTSSTIQLVPPTGSGLPTTTLVQPHRHRRQAVDATADPPSGNPPGASPARTWGWGACRRPSTTTRC